MDPASVPVLLAAVGVLALPFVRRAPFVLAVAIVNILIFLYGVGFWVLTGSFSIYSDLALRPDTAFGPRSYTLVTHMFLHANLLHILGNTIFLVFFGMPLEARIGPRRMAAIYLVSGVMAGVLDSLASIGIVGDVVVPRVGASGAIFGIMGAFLALYPHQRILMPFLVIIMEAPVWVGVLLYGGFETYLVLIQASDGIGHMAHVGGVVTGIIVAPLIAADVARRKRIAVDDLEVLARTPRQSELLDHIRGEDIPDIREAWLDEFVAMSCCPECGASVYRSGDRIRCLRCDWHVTYQHRVRRRGLHR